MQNKRIFNYLGITLVTLIYSGCSLPSSLVQRAENKKVPANYYGSQDTVNVSKIKWKDFFTDSNLAALIEIALKNNQELNITIQEINIAKNEVRARKGAYLPIAGIGTGASILKTPKFTSQGASDASNEIILFTYLIDFFIRHLFLFHVFQLERKIAWVDA